MPLTSTMHASMVCVSPVAHLLLDVPSLAVIVVQSRGQQTASDVVPARARVCTHAALRVLRSDKICVGAQEADGTVYSQPHVRVLPYDKECMFHAPFVQCIQCSMYTDFACRM
jgi:hypothetical protein